MTVSDIVSTVVQQGFTPAILFGLTFWNIDRVLSRKGAETLYRLLDTGLKHPDRFELAHGLEQIMSRYFSYRAGLARFFGAVFVLTVVSMAVLVIVYTHVIDVGLFEFLLLDGVLRQIALNGFVVTYLTNCFLLSLYPVITQQVSSGSLRVGLAVIVLDAVSKVLLFVVLEFVSFALFASLGDAFGGNVAEAILAVPPTILNAVTFDNLTAVYLYSVTVSSLPIFLIAFIKLLSRHDAMRKLVGAVMFWLPFENRPLRAIVTVFAVFGGMLVLTFSVVVSGIAGIGAA